MNTRFLLISVLSVSASVHAFTLPDAWQAALEYSADYRAARHARDADIEQKVQSRAALLPRLNASALYQRQPPSLSSTRETDGWQVQLNQTLFDAAQFARYRQSSFNSEAAEQQFRLKRQELLYQTGETYFRLQLAKETVAAKDAEKDAYLAQLHQAREMFHAGASTAVDIHEAQAGYDNAVAQQISAIAERQLLENRLEDYTGLNGSRISPLDAAGAAERHLPVLTGRTVEQWQQTALDNNPEYQAQLFAVKSGSEALRAARAVRLPTLSASVGYQDHRYTSSYQSEAYRYRGKGLSASVQLSMPLYSGGEIGSKIREQQARLLAEEAKRDATAAKIRLAVRQAYTSANAARYRITAQQRLLASSRLKLESTQTGRRYGIRNSLEVVQARQSLTQAEQKLAEARYSFLTAYLSLIKESGLDMQSMWRE